MSTLLHFPRSPRPSPSAQFVVASPPPTAESGDVAELPRHIQTALSGLDLSHARPQWVGYLLLNGDDCSEYWVIIARAILALKFFRKYPDRLREDHFLAAFDVPQEHPLSDLARTTVALLDDRLFPDAPSVRC